MNQTSSDSHIWNFSVSFDDLKKLDMEESDSGFKEEMTKLDEKSIFLKLKFNGKSFVGVLFKNEIKENRQKAISYFLT